MQAMEPVRAGNSVWTTARRVCVRAWLRVKPVAARVRTGAPRLVEHARRSVRGLDLALWRRARLWVVTGGLAFVAVLCAASLAALAMAQDEPAWWRGAVSGADDPARVALAVENGFLNHVYAPRRDAQGVALASDADGVWRVALTEDEANAWLQERLRAWFEHTNESWPRDLGEIRVHFSEGRISVGASVVDGERLNVLSATLRPKIDDSGSLWMPASGVRMGSLPVPMSWVFGDQRVADESDSWLGRGEGATVRRMPEAEVLLNAFSGEGPIVRDATVRLEDGRRVELLSVEAERGRLILTCRTR